MRPRGGQLSTCAWATPRQPTSASRKQWTYRLQSPTALSRSALETNVQAAAALTALQCELICSWRLCSSQLPHFQLCKASRPKK